MEVSMFIKCLTVGPVQTNCYILCDKISNRAAVIDPGYGPQRIVDALADTECRADYVILTHGHFDHMMAAHEVIKETGAKLAVYESELELLNDPEKNLISDAASVALPEFKPDILLHDGETLTLGVLELKILHTPGHTASSCSLICGDTIFSGDTLFYESVGRCDFPTSSFEDMRESIKRLLALEGDYKVLPGHGEFTTLSHEREFNPYARQWGRETDFHGDERSV
jgi:hydroxyacylglutathione hydrolase